MPSSRVAIVPLNPGRDTCQLDGVDFAAVTLIRFDRRKLQD